MSVTVLESHDVPGGAAHAWVKEGYHFESGPSLYSGMTGRSSTNPLAQVFSALEIDLPCYKYKNWMCHLPEGSFLTQVGAKQFFDILRQYSSAPDQAVKEWEDLQTFMEPLARASVALPPASFRQDIGAVLTAGKFLPNVIGSLSPEAVKLTGPFSELVKGVVKDEFIVNWLDLLCFLLSGLDASGTIAAEVAFMFNEWYQPNCELDFPVGGSQGMVDALVDGLRKYGGEIKLGAHVEEILVEDGSAKGVRVRYRNGERGTLLAKKAVVSNASAWNTKELLPVDLRAASNWKEERADFEYCPSFMHLHAGIDASKLPRTPEMHHIWVGDWKKGVTSPQNCVLVSIASVVDPSLAPEGKHVVHAYTPGNEPYEPWEGLERGSEEYEALKRERSKVLWDAVGMALGVENPEELCEVSMVGTPLTHERFLRRKFGTYGPALKAEAGQTLPFVKTSIDNLLCTGDSTFPGIGLPAVAASGMLAANSLTSVGNHLDMLRAIGL
ncbi:FAD/NAD(P)-binding domain-containing protein [Chloropicon primus]|nr:FAD/NAD(P)-binding domain-containing protein [Chloropicon primus]